MEPYLVNGLPMVDSLILDEADRMIADGHFKELNLILNHIYTKRVELKRAKKTAPSETQKKTVDEAKAVITKFSRDLAPTKSKNLVVGQNMELGGKKFDMSKVVDLDAEEDEEFMAQLQNQEDFQLDVGESPEEEEKTHGRK